MRRVRAAFYRKVGFITKSFVLMQVLYFSIHIRIHYFQGQQLPSHDANTNPHAFFLLHTQSFHQYRYNVTKYTNVLVYSVFKI